MTTTDIWLVDFACHDASCAPPPVGTGGSKPGGPSRGVLSPKASDRKNPPQSVVSDGYELRKHGLREAFDGQIKGSGLSFDETDVRWISGNDGWFVEGRLKNSADETVAYFERYYHVDSKGKLVATHETLKVYEEHQNKGYAQAFNDHLMNWYQKVGVDRIELRAGLEHGPYAWARQGYRVAGVEGGENRKRWVADRIDVMIKQARRMGARGGKGVYEESQTMIRELVNLKNASNRGEDIQPIHIASIGQGNDKWTWTDGEGTWWLGKRALVDYDPHTDDMSRTYDGVYYLGS